MNHIAKRGYLNNNTIVMITDITITPLTSPIVAQNVI